MVMFDEADVDDYLAKLFENSNLEPQCDCAE